MASLDLNTMFSGTSVVIKLIRILDAMGTFSLATSGRDADIHAQRIYLT